MRRDMDVTTNNIANASTTGFKSERVVFESYIQGDPTSNDSTNYVLDTGSYLDERQGSIGHTGNPLDVALQGPGWFAYRTEQGQMAYGRDGRLNINAQGQLVTLNGAKILDSAGSPIAVPPDQVAGVMISEDGTISAAGIGTVGVIGVFDLQDLQSFERIGGGMFVRPEGRDEVALVPDMNTVVTQGAVEGSNVQPVIEITRMMTIQKAYDRSLKLIGAEDELRQETLRRLGRTT